MSTVDVSILRLFEESLERCTTDGAFLTRFYENFVQASEEIAARFEGVDMKRQTHLLRASLYMMFRAAMGLADGVEHLETLSKTHSRGGYDIRPEFYEHWLSALLTTVEETDPHYDNQIRLAWEMSLRPGISVMVSRWAGA